MNRSIGRRELLAGAATLAGATVARPSFAGARKGFRAVAFDGLALFDVRPVGALVTRLFPAEGAELVKLWRVKQFDYQWLSALSGRYQDFSRATEGALVFAAKSLGIDLPPQTRNRLMQAWLELEAFPDVAPALRRLAQKGLRLAPLANFTPDILERAVSNSGLAGAFEQVISTDRKKTFKPDPRAYQLGVEAFRLKREEIAFVASAGWDVAGARWFGYPTFWVNRTGAPPEELSAAAHGVGKDLADLVAFIEHAAGTKQGAALSPP
jgi:2-haloacid dehalogenase